VDRREEAVTNWKLHEAKQDTECSLCSAEIERGETIVYGKGGNVTCSECIGPAAYPKPVRESLAAER
jgi:hypothetical protein